MQAKRRLFIVGNGQQFEDVKKWAEENHLTRRATDSLPYLVGIEVPYSDSNQGEIIIIEHGETKIDIAELRTTLSRIVDIEEKMEDFLAKELIKLNAKDDRRLYNREEELDLVLDFMLSNAKHRHLSRLFALAFCGTELEMKLVNLMYILRQDGRRRSLEQLINFCSDFFGLLLSMRKDTTQNTQTVRNKTFVNKCVERVLAELKGTGLYGCHDAISLVAHIFFDAQVEPSPLAIDENLDGYFSPFNWLFIEQAAQVAGIFALIWCYNDACKVSIKKLWDMRVKTHEGMITLDKIVQEGTISSRDLWFESMSLVSRKLNASKLQTHARMPECTGYWDVTEQQIATLMGMVDMLYDEKSTDRLCIKKYGEQGFPLYAQIAVHRDTKTPAMWFGIDSKMGPNAQSVFKQQMQTQSTTLWEIYSKYETWADIGTEDTYNVRNQTENDEGFTLERPQFRS